MATGDGLEVRLLGGFSVALGGRTLPDSAWRRRRAAAVVKLLALAPAHRLHREELVEALWPAHDAGAAGGHLRLVLHRARKQLEGAGAPPGVFLVRDGAGLALGPPDRIAVDVDAFEAAVAAAWRVADPLATQAAVERYVGDLLPEDPYEEWAADRRVVLRASYLTLLARLAHLHEGCGEPGQAIAALQRLVAAEPAQEEAHAELMRLYALTGQRHRALAQYARLVEVLARDLAAEPAPATRSVHEAIRDGRFPEAVRPLEPVSTPATMSPPLPVAVDALIGRARELAEVRQLLTSGRLVVLTGPGGVGKTRLALAVAQEVTATFPDGAAFVDLTPVRTPDLVVPTIAATLGVREAGGRPLLDALTVHLRERRLLLVLDNFEQVLAAARLVAGLLAGSRGLKVLATSRARLRLRGEREYPVGPLALPDPARPRATEALARCAAVALFVERAREARPDFRMTDETAPAVAAICRRLDGLPLALELAAARVRVLPPVQLVARLDRPLTLLTHGPRDLPERQRTLRDAIAWSHDLLSPAEQTLFRRLAVFVGGCTVEAAEAVSAGAGESPLAVLEGIVALVDQSLLRQLAGTGEEPRFGMLETIREFALERLEASGKHEEAVTRDAHARYFLALAERDQPAMLFRRSARLRSTEPPQGASLEQRERAWLDRLERDQSNLRAALDWALAHDPETAAQLTCATRRFWFLRGHWREGRDAVERALTLPSVAPEVRAELLGFAGILAHAQGDSATALARHTDALAAYRALADRAGEAFELMELGVAVREQGDDARATTLFEQSLALARGLDRPVMVGMVLTGLATAVLAGGEADRGRALLEEALALERTEGDLWGLPVALLNLGSFELQLGNVTRAAAHLREGLPQMLASGNRWLIAEALVGLACCGSPAGTAERAVRLFGAAAAVRAPEGYPCLEPALAEAAANRARLALGEEAFAAAWAAGRALSLAEAVAEALALANELLGSMPEPVVSAAADKI